MRTVIHRILISRWRFQQFPRPPFSPTEACIGTPELQDSGTNLCNQAVVGTWHLPHTHTIFLDKATRTGNAKPQHRCTMRRNSVKLILFLESPIPFLGVLPRLKSRLDQNHLVAHVHSHCIRVDCPVYDSRKFRNVLEGANWIVELFSYWGVIVSIRARLASKYDRWSCLALILY